MKLSTSQIELMPYFENVYLFCFAFCDECGENLDCTSKAKEYSDEYWMDYAKQMKDAGWVIKDIENSFCATCAESKNIKHNPKAYTLKSL